MAAQATISAAAVPQLPDPCLICKDLVCSDNYSKGNRCDHIICGDCSDHGERVDRRNPGLGVPDAVLEAGGATGWQLRGGGAYGMIKCPVCMVRVRWTHFRPGFGQLSSDEGRALDNSPPMVARTAKVNKAQSHTISRPVVRALSVSNDGEQSVTRSATALESWQLSPEQRKVLHSLSESGFKSVTAWNNWAALGGGTVCEDGSCTDMSPELCYERAFALVFEELKLKCDGVEAVNKVVALLVAAIRNLLRSPDDGKFRRIKTVNGGTWQSRMGVHGDVAVACMSQLGFRHDRDAERYVLPPDNAGQKPILKAALCVLEHHRTAVAGDNSSENGGGIPSGHATGSLRGVAHGDESTTTVGAKSIGEASDCAAAIPCRVVVDKEPVAGAFLRLDGSVKIRRALLDTVKLPRWCPEPDQQLTVPHVPSLYRSHKISSRHREVACLLEAFVSATGHNLCELGVSVASAMSAARESIAATHEDLKSGNDTVYGLSIGNLNRVLVRNCTSIGHSFQLHRLFVPPGRWLPLFVPMPWVLVSLHRVIQTGKFHWIAVNLARMAMFIAPSTCHHDDRADYVEGAILVELEDLTQGEDHFASHMQREYDLGPPERTYILMVSASHVNETNFHAQELLSKFNHVQSRNRKPMRDVVSLKNKRKRANKKSRKI